jgi:EAL domain-containing protein (putative c-di-GMP-specific phosphodiesterase class I)/GGDEF domain-containing protein
MSLKKQLLFGMITILTLTFMSLFFLQMNATQRFVERQLDSHAQDTATSLGLAISPALQGLPDIATIDTMVNAIFDRGYYRSITLLNTQNAIIIQRTNPTQIDSVPNWFQLLFKIQPPLVDSQVSNGWSINGTLQVQSHPGFAYEQLYAAAADNLLIYGTGLLITIVFSLVIVNVICQTLTSIQTHAQKLSDGDYQSIENVPNTLELKETVLSFNGMTNKLATVHQRYNDEIARFKTYALTDKQTNTGNRRAFEATLKKMLLNRQTLSDTSDDRPISEQKSVSGATGTMYIIRLTSLQSVSDKLGFNSQQQYTQDVVNKIAEFFAQEEYPQVYRLNDADFVVLSSVIEPEQRDEQINALYQHIKQIDKSEYKQGVVAIGAGEFSPGLSYDVVMTRTDNALTTALESQPSIYVHQTNDPVSNNTQWRAILDTIIAQESIEFVSQTIHQDKHVMYQEWFTRFNENDAHSTSDIFANAHKHGYMLEFDKLIVKHALAKLTKSPAKIAINLSRMALADSEFHDWFFDALPVSPSITRKLIIEIPERALVDDFQQINAFMSQAKIRFIQFTVERFGAQLSSIQHLKALRPDYLKLDPRYTFAIHLEDEQQRLVKTLVELAHSLGIKVIAEQVESEAQALCLESLNVDCLQGFEISKLEQVF